MVKTPPIPQNEAARLEALLEYRILDTDAEPAFDDLTRLAAHIAGTPIALVSLVDADRQWFKARYGLDAPETSRDNSFCGHVVASDAPLIVGDAWSDERFADNPLVTGQPMVRFYAGMPLRNDAGLVMGTLCAIDRVPRQLTPVQVEMLTMLAGQVVGQLELRHRNRMLIDRTHALETHRRFFDLTLDLFATFDRELRIQECNPAWHKLLGWTAEELRSVLFLELVHPDDVEPTVREAQRLMSESTPTVNFEHRFRHKDGRWLYLSWVVAVQDGVFFASARDVTSVHAQQAELASTMRAVAEERSRLQSIVSSANYAIIETAPNGVFREFNRAAEQMLGYTAAEVIGTRPPVHDPAEIIARAAELSAELGTSVKPGFEALVAKVRREGADEREWTYIRKDGSRLPVELSISARRNEAGEILGFMGIAADITDRKRAERTLKQQTQMWKLSADIGAALSATVSLAEMLRACAEAIVTNLGAAFARIWTLDETGTVLELQASAGLYTHIDGPHARVPVGAFKIGMIAQERTPHLTNTATSDPRVGDPEWARREGMVAFAGYPLLLGGRLVGVMAMFARHPVSDAELNSLGTIADSVAIGIERRRAESQLDQFKATLDQTHDSIFIIDPVTRRFSYVNQGATRNTGYSAAELIRMTPLELNPELDEALRRVQPHGVEGTKLRPTGRFRPLLEPAITGETPVVVYETNHTHKDGHDIPVEVLLQHIAHQGEPPTTIAVVRDISERKRVGRLQAEFVSTVSHELRTPLTSIRGALGLVAAGVTGPLTEETKEYVEIALSNSERLVRLINDILDIEKIQSGKIEFRLQAMDLAVLVEHALAANQPSAVAANVSLALISGLPQVEVVIDPDRFAQVMSNLISNAVKYSPPGASVELSVERIPDRVRISVRDHGPGIPEAFRSRIFQRFAQADTSTTRQKGGTGLGLSISKAIVEQMRGRISYEPAPGGGTRFLVDLPWLEPISRAATTSAPDTRGLVCEYDPAVYRLNQPMLVSGGFTVDVTPTLERARRLLAVHRYVAITLDLALADGDGVTLIHELRAAEATRQTPIVVISGSNRALGQSGVLVSDVILKPFDEEQLIVAVRRAVATCDKPNPRLLHVEDDEDIRRIVKKTLPSDWVVVGAGSVLAAKEALDAAPFDIVLLDLSLPDGWGDELIGRVGSARVIIFSAIDASPDVSRRVTAALVKTRSSSGDVRDLLLSLVGDGSSTRRP